MRPRPIYKNGLLSITRRTSRREFRLRPDEKTTKVLTYLLAVLADKYDIAIHAVCMMSNHWHALVTDRDGRIADFTRDFHSFTARHINALFNDEENLWSRAQTSHVIPDGPVDALDDIAYIAANPVAAGLVESGEQWPGLRGTFGMEPVTVRRPEGFLRLSRGGDKRWPAFARLEYARPPGFDELEDSELGALIEELVADSEMTGRNKVRSEGRRFIGAEKLVAQDRYKSPKTLEPLGDISPRVACKAPRTRITRLQANRTWLTEYKNCRLRFAAGERDVVFPYGTYKMRVVHGVRVAPA